MFITLTQYIYKSHKKTLKISFIRNIFQHFFNGTCTNTLFLRLSFQSNSQHTIYYIYQVNGGGGRWSWENLSINLVNFYLCQRESSCNGHINSSRVFNGYFRDAFSALICSYLDWEMSLDVEDLDDLYFHVFEPKPYTCPLLSTPPKTSTKIMLSLWWLKTSSPGASMNPSQQSFFHTHLAE